MSFNPTSTLKGAKGTLGVVQRRLQQKKDSVEARLEKEYSKEKPKESYIEYLKTAIYALSDIQIKVTQAMVETEEWIAEIKDK